MIDWQNVNSWVALVVDDEPDNLEVVAETLEYRGATVRTALDGLEALTVLADFTPNVIICDLSMPNMDGWELRSNIRSKPQFQDIPIVALSAHAMVGDKERALAAGFDGYLTKPVDIHTLVQDICVAAQEIMKSDE
jgi:CheY-like chemotaxis protein